MIYRYQPLYEDPEYYGEDAEDQYYEPEEEEDESGYYGA